jgi:hypothetical protein
VSGLLQQSQKTLVPAQTDLFTEGYGHDDVSGLGCALEEEEGESSDTVAHHAIEGISFGWTSHVRVKCLYTESTHCVQDRAGWHRHTKPCGSIWLESLFTFSHFSS